LSRLYLWAKVCFSHLIIAGSSNPSAGLM
jgi:hypothetical protein